MTHTKSRRRLAAVAILALAFPAAAGAAAALARTGSDELDPPVPRPNVTSSTVPPAPISKTDVTPLTPEPEDRPEELFDDPFVDGFLVTDVATAAQVLPFRPAAPVSLGNPVKVFLHRDYRPQALALVYDHPLMGHFALTQEPINMPESLQRQGLEQLAAQCNPTTGCVGSWTMVQLGASNRGLLISSTKVTAVIWIHAGGIRFQLMALASSMPAATAVGLANIIDAAA